MVCNEKQTLSQTADILGVSQATVRNWVRSGRITLVTRGQGGLLFSKQEIQQLATDIALGKLPYLRSRRNKTASQDKSVPLGYLATEKYDALAQRCLEIGQTIREDHRLELVLLEVYLQLLKGKGAINREGSTSSSLVMAWVLGEFSLGPYTELATELFSMVEDPTMSEIIKLEAFSGMVFEYEAGQDVLGFIYMSLSSLGTRKQSGSYYTPAVIVEQLVTSSLEYLEEIEPQIVDPCCGSGNFLINLFIRLKNNLLKQGLSIYQAEEVVTSLISGIDNHALAVTLAKMNLSLLLEHGELTSRIRVECQDTLRMPCLGNYDLIIGNPPWGYKYHRSELQFLAENYETATGAVESFNLFIEWALNNSTKQGIVAYVLPEAFLNVQSHVTARSLFKELGVIRQVNRLGHFFPQVNAPVIALVFQKAQEIKGAQVTVGDGMQIYNVCFQEAFIQEQYSVFAKPLEREIIKSINNASNIQYLKGNADFALGIVSGNNSKHLKETAGPFSEVIIRGTDVYKYRIKPGVCYLDYQPECYQQVAPDRFYRAPEKLVYRFVSKHMVFAYDDQQLLTLNSANIVIPRLEGVHIKYLLAVLNSRIMQFYRQVVFPSVKVLRKHLEMLPLCCPREKWQKPVILLVDKLLNNPREDNIYMTKIYNEIDQILMDYYQLPTEFQQYIKLNYQQAAFLN